MSHDFQGPTPPDLRRGERPGGLRPRGLHKRVNPGGDLRVGASARRLDSIGPRALSYYRSSTVLRHLAGGGVAVPIAAKDRSDQAVEVGV